MTDRNAPRAPQATMPRPGGGPGPGGMGRRIEKARDPRGALRRLVSYLRPYGWLLAGVLVLVVINTLLSLAQPYLMGVAIDRYISTKDLPGLLRIALLLGGAYLANSVFSIGQNWAMALISQRVLRALRGELFSHLQTLALRFFDQRTQGELMSRLTNDIDAINQGIAMSLTQLLGSLFSVVGIIGAMFALNVRLALGAMTVLPLIMILTTLIGRHTRTGFRQLQSELGHINGLMEETISGQRVVQAFRRENTVLADFDDHNLAVRQAGVHAQTFALLMPPMMTVLTNASIAIVAGLGGWLALQNMVTVGVIAAFITYARRFTQPLRQLADLYNTIQSALAGAERVFQILDEAPEITDADDAVPLDEIRGDVEFDHVDFSYAPGVPVLHDVSLHARPGETVALVGPTGAGKTTVVNLLTRFYDIDGGAIRIDGHDIRHVRRDDLRRRLGIVLQDTYLFADTVMENIRYGRLDARDDEVIAAATLANADQFIRRLPDGYQTPLSERGSNLSQGQRQLLSIARAILANPSILVLDEATSSVDTRTEVRIQEALLRLMEGRTAFVIAHRLSTIRNADQVLVIDDGRIIEQGTHPQLLALSGFYYNLYMSQFKGMAPDVAPGAAEQPDAMPAE